MRNFSITTIEWYRNIFYVKFLLRHEDSLAFVIDKREREKKIEEKKSVK